VPPLLTHCPPSRPAVSAACRLILLAFLAAGSDALAANVEQTYGIEYLLTPEPGDGWVNVEVELEQDRGLLREMRFDGKRVSDVEGDGKLKKEGGDYVWLPPASGGKLSWRADVRHKRNNRGYDAWLDENWGLFRAEDVIPRASTRGLRDAFANTSIRFLLPEGWSAVTEYREFDGHIPVPPGSRRFKQPAGWIVIGELGVRREKIAGTRVAVAAPVGEDVRRMDLLALLNWTLPELARLLPEPLPRLTVVSAGEPMWRGALSAPQSFYMHADRPLISENGTSTPLHELMHVALGITAERGYDWIVEGFAEYYSLELLRRSGSISLPRYDAAIDELRRWSQSAESLCNRHSTGADTALAVTVMHALDREIDNKTDGRHDLDDLLYTLLTSGRKMSLDQLRDEAGRLIGKNPDALRNKRLPGCAMLGD
jgi:hypothetical protein